MRKHGVQRMKRKPAAHQSEELAKGPYPEGNNPEDIQEDLRGRTEEPEEGAIKERNKSIKGTLNNGQLLIKYTLKIVIAPRFEGRSLRPKGRSRLEHHQKLPYAFSLLITIT
ncbi:hypothetical protein E3N88_36574 [Mikania micrantha]|uniref:Uncharacterized protein n=1 Tax=Mikania micrantha TaxID=192012 RepID=A0A5N6M418_9ASTR|nr:hypothetical protein E3N88_36574 [Mikania micrantha]